MSPSDLSPLNEDRAEATPFPLFARWLCDAEQASLLEPGATTLATAATDGAPAARMVLLRGYDERGFCFYTNFTSRKAAELAENPRAALVFYWAPLQRQVRIEGRVEKVSPAESDEYFAKRPRGHQLGAWASPQSQVIASRQVLEAAVSTVEERFQGKEVPRPDFWGGYRVVPQVIEFWQGGENRLHDRLRYTRQSDGTWLVERLAP